MEFRPKNYRPKRMGLYNQKRVVVSGIPEYLLFQKCKTNKFKYVSAEIGSAILSYRWFIEGGGADQIRSLDSNYGFILVKLYFLVQFITYYPTSILDLDNIYILVRMLTSKVKVIDYFLIVYQYSSPHAPFLFYLDTDSFHVGLARQTLNECILPSRLESWNKQFLTYFDPDGISCVLLVEKQANCATYYAGNFVCFFD
jgi:hypothetical protein